MINAIENVIDINPERLDVTPAVYVPQSWRDLSDLAHQKWPAETKIRWRAHLSLTIEFVPEDGGMTAEQMDNLYAQGKSSESPK